MILKKIKLLYTSIVTTAYRYDEDQYVGSLLDAKKTAGALKEYQKVIAVGSMVRDIKEGDIVAIDPSRYAVKKHQEGSLKDGVITDNVVLRYNIPMIELDGEDCLYLQDRDIRFIVEEYEEEEEKPHKSKLYVPDNKLIVN